MADFALGLTKTAVEGTLSRVQLAIDEETKLRVTAKQDLRYITAEFQMMQSFLKVANKERANNEVVRTWVRQLRDLAFDVEDCVEFVVHLDNNSALVWLWRLVPSCMAPLRTRDLDMAVAELKQLKARVEDASQRNTRYNLINDSGSFAKTTTAIEHAALTTTTNTSAFHMLCEVWEAAGKRRGISDLQKLIMGQGSDLQVISVWGSSVADLGTTSIFSMLYADPEIRQAYKRCAWVKLTHPFKPDEFLKTLLAQFYMSSHQENIDVDNLTKAELMQQVKAHRYLIILEEVFSVVDWDAIRVCLPDNKNGSRIIVSTKQVRTAFFCTGGTYQVSELRRFSDDQSLCAFSKKIGRRSGMQDLLWQIRCRGVISVWGCSDSKSTLINKVYTSIVYKCRQFEGVEFQQHSWVDIPVPFNLEVFSRRLLVSLRSKDLQAKEIAVVGMMGESSLTQQCCEFLQTEDCLVIINDLQSTHAWDLIKVAFLSKPIKGCILIITNESSVARHCVEEEDGVLNIEDLEANFMLRPLIKGFQKYENGGNKATHRGRLFSIRLGEIREWFTKFKFMYQEQVLDLWYNLDNPGVTSLWGPAGAGKSIIARIVYYSIMLRSDASWECEYQERLDFPMEKRTMFSWVDVPHPFNLKEFSWRLLLDFHSDDPQAKKHAAVGMMEGQDTIQECSKLLRENKCIVVINGLQSTNDWDLIQATLLSYPMISNIVVITDVASVAAHCVDGDRAMEINCLEADVGICHPIKGCASRVFSNRSAEARDLINTFGLLGRQNESARKLRRSLVFSGPSVTSVWGIAGVGKSAVARSVYSHLMLGQDQYFLLGSGHNLTDPRTEFTMCSWVDVHHPLNLTDLSCHLLLDFHSDDLQVKEKAAIGVIEGQDPIQECRRIMCEYRTLIVIDGLRSREDWDLIKAAFLLGSSNACVIVITNEESIATHCVDNNENQLVNVKGLEADMALTLFKKVMWNGKELTPGELEIYKVTIGRCGGIPKVIVTVGQFFAKAMAAKHWQWEWKQLLKDLNDDFMGTLGTDQQGCHSLRDLFSWMHSYFDACSDSLKPCIFYLSIFPPNQNIRLTHLLRRWIAEGYCRDTSIGTAEENGKRLFSELINLSIIQKCQKAIKSLYQVNGFFHEYIISRPMEDNLVFALEGHYSLNSQHAGQHLTIRKSWDRDIMVFRRMDFSRLRSLTVFGKWMPFFLSSSMTLLRVLDMAGTSGILDGDLEQIAKVLPRLKFLSLRGCKEISHLPESFGGLRQLQTLDVRHTSIVRLPLCIIKLQKLQYIRAGTITSSDEGDESVSTMPTTSVDRTATPLEGSNNMVTTLPETEEEIQTSTPFARSCQPRSLVPSWLSKLHIRRLDNDGVEVPVGIGSLTALHTIGVVNANIPNSKAILKDLKNLTQLRKLGVSGISRRNIQELCYFISGHGHLESLSVRLDKDKRGLFACFDDMIFDPPKTLKSLKLYGHVYNLPIWIKQLDNLKKLDLELTIPLQEDVNFLDELPNDYCLRRLCVKPIQDGELHFSRVGGRIFWNLQVLEIDCTSKLQVTFVELVIMEVEVLKLNCSGKSSLRISGLEHLLNLNQVWLKGSYSDAIKQELQQQLSEHAKKPVLKLLQ